MYTCWCVIYIVHQEIFFKSEFVRSDLSVTILRTIHNSCIFISMKSKIHSKFWWQFFISFTLRKWLKHITRGASFRLFWIFFCLSHATLTCAKFSVFTCILVQGSTLRYWIFLNWCWWKILLLASEAFSTDEKWLREICPLSF